MRHLSASRVASPPHRVSDTADHHERGKAQRTAEANSIRISLGPCRGWGRERTSNTRRTMNSERNAASIIQEIRLCARTYAAHAASSCSREYGGMLPLSSGSATTRLSVPRAVSRGNDDGEGGIQLPAAMRAFDGFES